jgi:hypothetical protein
VKLTAVVLANVSAALAHAVEEIPDQLMRDKEPQQAEVATASERPEKGCAVGVSSLVGKNVKRVVANVRIRDLLSGGTPALDLARHRCATPHQLARNGGDERPKL